jgi:hypothetical protein
VPRYLSEIRDWTSAVAEPGAELADVAIVPARLLIANLVIAMFAAIAVLFVAAVVASYRWEYEHDSPLLQYTGLLISKFGMVPYRDFFETNMPGPFLFHAAIVRFLGTGNLSFVFVMQIFLVALLAMSWLSFCSILFLYDDGIEPPHISAHKDQGGLGEGPVVFRNHHFSDTWDTWDKSRGRAELPGTLG